MTEIRFYHMQRSSLEQTLPALLTKALSQGHRILVKTTTPAETESLNTHLWTYNPESFLPHGSQKDGHLEQQPIILSDQDNAPNNASVLILTNGAKSKKIAEFKLCCQMLDGNNPQSVQDARESWKNYKEQGFSVTYWQQGDNGWEKMSG